MDIVHDFDNVKAEKANAMRSYRVRQLVKWGFRAFVGLIVLAQSTTWVPIAVKSTIHFLRDLISIFNCHLYVFILFNAIIFLVYAFSSLNPTSTANDNNKQPKTSTDLYDEFVFNSSYGGKIPTRNQIPVPENSFEDKHVLCSENAVSSSAKSNQKDLDSVSVENRGAFVENKALVVKCYPRTQSESYKRSEGENIRPEFRRSNTNKHLELKSSSKTDVTVDGTSNEEFNRRIEAFIAAQKWIQREEYKEEQSGMALTNLRQY